MTIVYFVAGLAVYAFFRVIATGWYVVKPDERAVVTSFGKAQRAGDRGDEPAGMSSLSEEEKARYRYPRVKVKMPGGPYLKFPWQRIHKVRVATEAVDLCWDPSKSQSTIESVTKDNLTIGVNGQIRFRVSSDNLYAYLFGVDSPLEHVMGYFISVMRERIANFVDPNQGDTQGGTDSDGGAADSFQGVSVNDLRKNLPLLNTYMEEQCRATAERYGLELDAALITAIDPPAEVDHALSAINSTRNQVAADISTARADAEQQITLSLRAVEIARNNAESEVAPLRELSKTLSAIKAQGGATALEAYVKNLKIPLLKGARRVVQEG